MNEFKADLDQFRDWASRLAAASDDLSGAAKDAPDPPNAGRCTALVAGALSQLCTGMGTITDGMAASGKAVADGGSTYHQTDSDNADRLGGH